jgi:ABC-type proline/glycine betaine transport system permease subunit
LAASVREGSTSLIPVYVFLKIGNSAYTTNAIIAGTPMRRLTKVELPIAMPVIMAGIRTAMVLIIGTATLAALIGNR